MLCGLWLWTKSRCWNPLSRATPWWVSGMLCSAWNMIDLDGPLGTLWIVIASERAQSSCVMTLIHTDTVCVSLLMMVVMMRMMMVVAVMMMMMIMMMMMMMRAMTDEHDDDDVKDDAWWWQQWLWPFGNLCVCAYYLICGMVSWVIVRTLLYLENHLVLTFQMQSESSKLRTCMLKGRSCFIPKYLHIIYTYIYAKNF